MARMLGKRKIGKKWYRNIGSYETRLLAQKQAARWLREGYGTKIIRSKAKGRKYPWKLCKFCWIIQFHHLLVSLLFFHQALVF